MIPQRREDFLQPVGDTSPNEMTVELIRKCGAAVTRRKPVLQRVPPGGVDPKRRARRMTAEVELRHRLSRSGWQLDSNGRACLRCRNVKQPGILAVREISVWAIHATSDDHLDHWLNIRALHKIAIVAHNDGGVQSWICIGHQSQRCNGIGGQDVTLAPRNPSIPLPHR
jgi:hypothetical protein